MYTAEENIKFAMVSELNYLYNKYDISNTAQGMLKNPGSVDYDAFPVPRRHARFH